MFNSTDRYCINLKPTLNRLLMITSYPLDKPLPIGILFNKKSSALEAQYNTKSDIIVNKEITIRLHRNLNNCMFSNTFFKLEDIQDKFYDYRTKFVDVNQKYSNVLINFLAEKLELRTNTNTKEKDKSNYLMVTGWKLHDCDSDLIYYFVQRKFYNVTTRKKIIRTMGIQLSNTNGYDVLSLYNKDYKDNNPFIHKKVELPEEIKMEEQIFKLED
jgi:hypothetical protein